MTPLTISVVIPTYNGLTYLEPCLDALLPSLAADTEVLVVDNASTDGTQGRLATRFPHVTVLRQSENLGFAEGCNAGAARARGTWILFLNNDTIPAPGFVEPLLARVQQDPKLGVCTSKIRVQSAPDHLDAIGSFLTRLGFLRHVGLLELDQGQHDHLQQIFSPKGVCFLIRRNLFHKLGGFDERYFAYFEETDLFWRVWLHGWRIGFAPASIVYHKIGGTSSTFAYAFIDYHNFKNRIRTLLKNLALVNLCWLLPVHMLCCAGLSLLSMVKGRWGSGWAIVRAIAWNIRHLPETWGARRRAQRLRRVSDRELFRYILWPVPLSDFARYTFWAVASREKMRAQVHAGQVHLTTK